MPSQTRLDSHADRPSTTAPGDGPADTTDPTERATTVGGDKAAAVRAGYLTVNAAIPLDEQQLNRGVAISSAMAPTATEHRFEEYDATRPDGTVVRVRHNIDTGDTEII